MILGALLDAGLPLDDLRRALGSLAIDRDGVWVERVARAGISATKFHVRGEEPPIDHAHDHQSHRHASDDSDGQASGDSHRHAPVRSHHHETHRTLAQIGQLIESSALSHEGKRRARAMFARLGEAEAAIHGTALDQVHLHEVGAIDSIIDIVGTVYAMETFNVDEVIASPLNVGSGTVRVAHGVYPVPAPATIRLLQGAPVYSGPQKAELMTPTGALLITEYAKSYGAVPPMRVERVGYGAGSRDVPECPNVLRVLIGEGDRTSPARRVVVIEADIDDMNPQIFGVLIDQLIGAGALDVFYTSIQMKKNRPGTLLTIVAAPDARERLTKMVFRETTTIGVRYTEMERECLDRETTTVHTACGQVRIKVARRNGEVLNASPEFDDCVRLAAESGKPIKDVQAAAMKAFLDR